MKNIYKIIITLIVLIPGIVFAIPTTIEQSTDFISPRRNTDHVRSTYYVASSTTATSTFYGAYFATSTNPSRAASTGIVAWGDSLTEGQGLGRFSYPNELQRILGRTVYNRGVSAERSSQIANRFLNTPEDFDMPVIIWAGTNDRAFAGASTTVIANINSMISSLSSTTRYLVLSAVSQGDEIVGSANHTAVVDINTWLSATYGSHYLDVWQHLKNNNDGSGQDLTDVANGVTPTSLRDDLIHMNKRGYRLIAEYIADRLAYLQLENPDGSVINQYALNNTLNSPNTIGLVGQDVGYFKSISINASTTETYDPRDWQFLTIQGTDQPRNSRGEPAYNTFKPYTQGTVSTNQVPAGGFTSTTGWTGSMSTGYLHTVGNTNALEVNIVASTSVNDVHLVSFDVSGRTAGSFSVTLAGNFGSTDDNLLSPFTFSTNQHYELAMFATSSSQLRFIPTTDFDGRMTNIRVQKSNRDTASLFTINDADGNSDFELRTGSSTLGNIGYGKNAGANLAPQSSQGALANMFFGRNTGANFASGVGNTMFGYGALATSYSTQGNTGVGTNVLSSNTLGQYNTAVGMYNLLSNTSGDYITAVGTQALVSNSSGDNSTALGTASLWRNTTGSNNTALGYFALQLNVSGSGNVAVGNYAGGYETGSNAFYVDNQNRTNTAGDKAGALLYGVFDSTPANQLLTINASTTIAQRLTTPFASTTVISANSICISTDCRTSWPAGGGGSGAFPFTNTLFGATNANATSTLIGFTSGIYSLASSTIGNGNQNGGLTISGGATTTGSVYVGGNVGIGSTLAPSERLTLTGGNIRFNRPEAPGAVTTALGAAGVLTGTYAYRISYVTAVGETEVGIGSTSRTPAAQQIDLTSIPVSSDPTVTGRRIYRNKTADGVSGTMYLVTTINDNTTTTYSDNIADGSLGAASLQLPTAGGVTYLNTRPILISHTSMTAVGLDSLKVNTAPSNTGVGNSALTANTTGAFNTATGEGALLRNTTGSSNTSMGSYSLQFNLTGGSNTAFGSGSLGNNTASNNTAFGLNSGNGNTSGTLNTYIGRSAGNNNQTGSNNTLTGYQSGNGVSTNSYSNNSFYGFQSGVGITTGSQNLCIGATVCDELTTGSNNIAIGYDIDVPSNTLSNTLNIGNIIFGININSTDFTPDADAGIGIGTSTPTGRFVVSAGTANTDGNLIISPTAGANRGLTIINNSLNARLVNSNIVSVAAHLLLQSDTGAGSVLVGSSTALTSSKLQVFDTATSTISIDSSSTSRGGCIEIKDRSGVGYTYITAEDGVLTASTVSCK